MDVSTTHTQKRTVSRTGRLFNNSLSEEKKVLSFSRFLFHSHSLSLIGTHTLEPNCNALPERQMHGQNANKSGHKCCTTCHFNHIT